MQYDFSMNANGGQNIEATGAYVKYKSGLGMIRIKFSTGGYVDMTPGQGIRLKNQEFNSLNLTDKSGIANKGMLVIGDVEFQDDTIVGTVSIVDGGKNSTMAQTCFLGTVNSGAVAGNYNMSCLINPGGSGKNVVVESIIASVTAAVTIGMYMLSMSPAGSTHAQNKYAGLGGGSQSLAFIEQQTTGTLAIGVAPFQRAATNSNSGMVRKFAEPLIIPPGMGIVVICHTMATAIDVDFEFREDAV